MEMAGNYFKCFTLDNVKPAVLCNHAHRHELLFSTSTVSDWLAENSSASYKIKQFGE